jgi:hypothetical protein
MTMTSTLNALDRCDRCGAQARVRYDLNGLELLFCGHHDNQNRAALLDKGATIVADDLLLAEATAGLEVPDGDVKTDD